MPTVPQHTQFGTLGAVCRLGLATRGNTHLSPDDVHHAVERGVNYLNWCAHSDGMSQAIRDMTDAQRRDVFVAAQFMARTADSAKRELDEMLAELGTEYVDVLTYYYVEHEDQWRQIIGRGGAADMLENARSTGQVRAIGMTTHQRPLAATVAQSGRLDMLMVRYNAAHRGAEDEVFPVTEPRGMPVVAFTITRWGALAKPTPVDPPAFNPPPTPQWYRFALQHPAVTVAIMAPNDREQLDENLTILDDWRTLTDKELETLAAHGQRVREHAGRFP